MAGGTPQKVKCGNKHGANVRRSDRKYGLRWRKANKPAKAGKRHVYCGQYPHCIHAARTRTRAVDLGHASAFVACWLAFLAGAAVMALVVWMTWR